MNKAPDHIHQPDAVKLPRTELRDLPAWLWLGWPPVVFAALLFALFTGRDAAVEWMLRKEVLDEGLTGGLVEHLTILVLLPGIVICLVGLLVYRRNLPVADWRKRWGIAGWFGVWVLACLYFAGEEASWGQHAFGYHTPPAYSEFLQSIGLANDQGEMNLHNTSSWLDQKPRTLVELFIIVAGLIVPVVHRINRSERDPHHWSYWIFPTHVCIPVASLFFCTWLWEKLGDTPLFARTRGIGEMREYYIALFLAIYLLSFAYRLMKANVAQVRPLNGDLSSPPNG